MILKKILDLIILKLILIFLFTTHTKASPDINFMSLLKENGKVIFIRHAYAPGNGDPENFDLSDCSTQRNLDDNGIYESKKIGVFFKKHDIAIDIVLSSEWCRCKDTANYAFKKFEVKNFLNSFYSQKFYHNKSKQIKDLKRYVKNWNGKKNLVFVTHFVLISEVLNISALPAEIIISDKNFNFLSRHKIINN